MSGLTPKGAATRKQILETALRLFAEKGYQATTMRDIADEAGCALGLIYRYFERKEDLVLAFYQECAVQLEEEVAALWPGPLARRVEQAMQADIARMGPYRDAFGGLLGVGFSPESEVAVLGKRVEEIRERVWRVFLSVVTGATDAPKGKAADDLATIFYAAHLLLVLFWLQDRSDGRKSTQDMIKLIGELVRKFRPALRLPFVRRTLTRAGGILGPMFGPKLG